MTGLLDGGNLGDVVGQQDTRSSSVADEHHDEAAADALHLVEAEGDVGQSVGAGG
ncbi:MAG TPA: hypothetical protein VF635_12350 [Propionibacteriaceae bacterium]|jgi:hypothetical protein